MRSSEEAVGLVLRRIGLTRRSGPRAARRLGRLTGPVRPLAEHLGDRGRVGPAARRPRGVRRRLGRDRRRPPPGSAAPGGARRAPARPPRTAPRRPAARRRSPTGSRSWRPGRRCRACRTAARRAAAAPSRRPAMIATPSPPGRWKRLALRARPDQEQHGAGDQQDRRLDEREDAERGQVALHDLRAFAERTTSGTRAGTARPRARPRRCPRCAARAAAPEGVSRTLTGAKSLTRSGCPPRRAAARRRRPGARCTSRARRAGRAAARAARRRAGAASSGGTTPRSDSTSAVSAERSNAGGVRLLAGRAPAARRDAAAARRLLGRAPAPRASAARPRRRPRGRAQPSSNPTTSEPSASVADVGL